MSTEEKNAMLAKIAQINQVEGFDPNPFAMELSNLSNGETRRHLPVMIRLAWFRLRYPEGKVAVQVTQVKERFVANARIYASYRDPVDAYLAEASASRGKCADNQSISPREWAQTAAIGVALKYAGFGLQYDLAGEDEPEQLSEDGEELPLSEQAPGNAKRAEMPEEEYTVTEQPPQKELTEEEQLELAMQMPCPITKYAGKTLGEVMCLNANAINWLATKYTGDESIQAAARFICEYTVAHSEQTA